MKYRLQTQGVISALLILVNYSVYSQPPTDIFSINGYSFRLDKKEMQKMVDGCGDILNSLSVQSQGKVLFSENICAVEMEDVRFTTKGYLTVLEHYSSPVGWTKYYIFDLCKKRLIKTRRIDETEERLVWEAFIELSESTRKKYVEQVIDF
jgi:hypothetical protein